MACVSPHSHFHGFLKKEVRQYPSDLGYWCDELGFDGDPIQSSARISYSVRPLVTIHFKRAETQLWMDPWLQVRWISMRSRSRPCDTIEIWD